MKHHHLAALLPAVVLFLPALRAEETPGTSAPSKEFREIRQSPDGKSFVAWVDRDFGPPVGEIRSVILRVVSGGGMPFSLVTYPRHTWAAWNSSSTRCVIADAPDNGGPTTWLVVKDSSPDGWSVRKIEPFAALATDYYRQHPGGSPPYRPWYRKIEWISDTQIRFDFTHNNRARHLITFDTDAPNKAPVTKPAEFIPPE